MESIDDYRAQILTALRAACDADGNPKLTEKQALELSNELKDNELMDGMPYNTPEEVAELLLDSGLE
ncbi:MAG: hypothetical protein WCS15_02755 [Prevotella sp.]|nr:hypothetical protein [Prevotella sp.]MDD3388099.1 hypothetical protein [Prevotella sp.]MDD4533758.1 hypothetical protein [Prevotella sp.]